MKTNGLLFSLILVLTVACSESGKQETVKTVKVVKPEPLGMVMDKQFSGVVKEAHEISVGFKTGGQIERVLVKEGDYIHQGQVVAVLDKKDYKLGVEASQIQYDQLNAEVARLKVLHEAKSVSGNDYEKALAGLQQVGVQLQSNKNKLEYCTLYAPASGYVQQRNYEPGEMVQAGAPIITLLDVNGMEVEVDIPSIVYVHKETLSNFSCSSSLNPGQSYPLTLRSITPKANNSQLYTMILAFGKRVDGLTSGMNVNVSMDMTIKTPLKNLMILPVNALFKDSGKSYVWVVSKDSCVERREVDINSFDQYGKIIIKGGLNGDETIVRAGVHHLVDKQKVQILEDSSETNVGGML